MRKIALPFGIVSFLLGILCVFMGFMEPSGVLAFARADRWQEFILEEGVKDRTLAQRISLRLSKDVTQPPYLSYGLMVAGGMLLLNGSVLLAVSAKQP